MAGVANLHPATMQKGLTDEQDILALMYVVAAH